MCMSKEEIQKEIDSMTEDELNDFAFFSLKVLDERCDIYEKLIYLMASYIYNIQLNIDCSINDIYDYFIKKLHSTDVRFNREELTNAIGNK